MYQFEQQETLVLHTSMGDIGIALFPEIAVKASENFLGPRKERLLRRADLSPRHPGFYDPGRRPGGDRPGRREHMGPALRG